MNKIEDYSIYNKGMEKSVVDKTDFYLYKLNRDIDIAVDFGCADGAIIQRLKSKVPNCEYVGYDYDTDMLELARKRNTESFFTDNWNEVSDKIKGKKSAIIITSTIHEVYSYGNNQSVALFWKRVFETGFTYIIIRDMLPCLGLDSPVNNSNLIKLSRAVDPKQLDDFQNIWGNIDTNKKLYHFLLKYTYTDNWKREVNENYFSVNIGEMINLIPENYGCDLIETYSLKPIRDRVKRDFNITMKYDTHAKLILKLK